MIAWWLGCGAPEAPPEAIPTPPVVPPPAGVPVEAPSVPSTGDIPLSNGGPSDRAALYTTEDLRALLPDFQFDPSKDELTRRRTGSTWELRYVTRGPPGVFLQSDAYIAGSEADATRAWTAIGVGATNGSDHLLTAVDSDEKPGWGTEETCKQLEHDGRQVGWYCWSRNGDRVGAVLLMVTDGASLGRVEPFVPRLREAFSRIDRWTP